MSRAYTTRDCLFERIYFLRDVDLLTLLQSVDNEDLLFACIGMDQEFVQRIAGQFSSLGRQYFLEDLSRFSQFDSVEQTKAARLKIEAIYFNLIESGKLSRKN